MSSMSQTTHFALMTHSNQEAANACERHCTTSMHAFQQRLLVEHASAIIQQLNIRLSPAVQEATAFLEEQHCKMAKEVQN
jgi:hypothetical protein